MATLNIPPIYAYIQRGYLEDTLSDEMFRIVIDSVTVIQDYGIGFNILTSFGMRYDYIPIMHISTDNAPARKAGQQHWNCFSSRGSISQRGHMRNQCVVYTPTNEACTYLFTIEYEPGDPDISVTMIPEERKCHHVLLSGDSGRLIATPNTYIIVKEPSFCTDSWPEGFKPVSGKGIYSVE
jgi:hypothetical protein